MYKGKYKKKAVQGLEIVNLCRNVLTEGNIMICNGQNNPKSVLK